jgi:hypothetical protein
MSTGERKICTAAELLTAAADSSVHDLVLAADLNELPAFRLSPGQALTSTSPGFVLRFAAGQDGVQLSANNRVENIELNADPNRRALFNDTSMEGLGRLVLRNLRATGAVHIVASNRVRSGHVEVENLDVAAADARALDGRAKGYGVEVMPGAFTLWNRHSECVVTITADVTGLTVGRAGAPVRGSGVFVGGGGDAGGRLIVHRPKTGTVCSHGGIAPGTADRIAGGVFVVSGAFVDSLRNRGPITTYGPNDMVLDNWGTVRRWIAEEKVTSYGPSGIGFVNFGTLDQLRVNAPIETFGQGARGFNIYAGRVNSAEFERVVTHADGAVGIQVSRPVGRITVHRGIETHGGLGDSLVKGVVVKLSAVALSIKPGGSARKIVIAGGLITHGKGVNPLELHGSVDTLQITEGFAAAGGGFEEI